MSNVGALGRYIGKWKWLRARKAVPDFQQAWVLPVVFNFSSSTKASDVLLHFHGNNLLLTVRERRCGGDGGGGGGQRGGTPAGSRWCVCLLQCLHMAHARRFMAVPPPTRIPRCSWGSGVAVVPCAAGQLLLLSAATCQPNRGTTQWGRRGGGATTCTANTSLGQSLFKRCVSCAEEFIKALTFEALQWANEGNCCANSCNSSFSKTLQSVTSVASQFSAPPFQSYSTANEGVRHSFD